jgi:hypothetical protein
VKRDQKNFGDYSELSPPSTVATPSERRVILYDATNRPLVRQIGFRADPPKPPSPFPPNREHTGHG